MHDLDAFLGGALVEAAIFELRPDYRALLLGVEGIRPGDSDERSEALLVAAESSVRELGGRPVGELEHIASWRDAYRAFGAKPTRTRNSLEALTRRAGSEAGCSSSMPSAR
jgi:DNA/RNA-binding domain of Phe-tRNA-synthetase-like protein